MSRQHHCWDDGTWQPKHCQQLMPSYGHTAKVRAGIEVTAAIKQCPGAAGHSFMASCCGEGDWPLWLTWAKRPSSRPSPSVASIGLRPVCGCGRCRAENTAALGTAGRQPSQADHPRQPPEELHVPGRALHSQAKPYMGDQGCH